MPKPASQIEPVLSGQEICWLMRRHKLTIRALAARMNITLKRIRQVRTDGVRGSVFCMDWREGITGSPIETSAEVQQS